MSEPVPRLGDVVDDYCPRCRLLLNHAVASLVQAKAVKVVCQTCHSEHPYRNAEVPQKKKPSPRTALFEQILQKSASAEPELPQAATPSPAPDVPPKRKKAGVAARYISRHTPRPPRRGR